jgi:acyl-CoA synthetase (AMP-forming)/AMP-acid ligase II
MPKGVMWRAEDIFFGALESLVGAGTMSSPEEIGPRAVDGRTRCLPACPFMHGTAHWAALATLFGGGVVVVSPDRRLDPARLWQLVVDEEVNFLVIVGDAFARPLVDALEADPGRFDLSPLKILLSGGAILSPVVKEALVRLLPGALVIDGIGASETGGQGNMIGAGAGEGPPRFVMNDDTSVLDDELRPVAPGSGTIGRLARRGRVPLGYYKDPDKSAATFPVIDGVRWSVPGDMAMVEEDGSVLLLGRGSVSINTGGEKVFPEEVEAALKAHPAIFDAVVVGVPDERWGQRVVAVVQLRAGASVDLDAAAEHARTLIAGYKVPRGLVVVDAIVRSPSGKPDYRWAKNVALETVALETKETS